jgi:hypothetical protein
MSIYVDHNWQMVAWNPTINMILKPIANPIPMYARNVGGSMMGEIIPDTNEPAGFDLMIGDWVKPYGNGETPDFIIRINVVITGTFTKPRRFGKSRRTARAATTLF